MDITNISIGSILLCIRTTAPRWFSIDKTYEVSTSRPTSGYSFGCLVIYDDQDDDWDIKNYVIELAGSPSEIATFGDEKCIFIDITNMTEEEIFLFRLSY